MPILHGLMVIFLKVLYVYRVQRYQVAIHYERQPMV